MRDMSRTSGKHGERLLLINNGEVSLHLSVENYGIEFSIKLSLPTLRGGVISDCVIKKFIILNEL